MTTIDDLANEQGRSPDPIEAAELLAALLDLPRVGLRITGARIVGRGSQASADLYLSDNTVITFETLRDFATPKLLAIEIAAATGATPALTAPKAIQGLALLRALAETTEAFTEDELARGWGVEYLQAAKVIELAMSDQAERWRAFSELSRIDPRADARAANAPLVNAQVMLADQAGARYVRSGWFLDTVREQTFISPRELSKRMSRIGWLRPGGRGAIKATAPGTRAKPLIWTFYIVPASWETDDDDQ